MALANLYRAAWLRLQLFYYEAAQQSVQRRNPCHEDIPFFLMTKKTRSDQLEQLKGAA